MLQQSIFWEHLERQRSWKSTITAGLCVSSEKHGDEFSRWLIPLFMQFLHILNMDLSESCIAELIIQTCYRDILKHYFTGNERMGVSRCLCCLGCDAAGALASPRPPDETGGRHRSGLCERDHDPHALPPARDHHFHIQTGIAASPQAAFCHHFQS